MLTVDPQRADYSAIKKSIKRLRTTSRSGIQAKIKLIMNKSRSKCLVKFVFHPESVYRMIWDLLLLILILYQALTVPYFICFSDDFSLALQNFELMISMIFFLDILFSLNTAFYIKGSLVVKRSEIVKSYMRLWFWVDILASFPYSWTIEGVYSTNSTSSSPSNIYNAPKVIRIIRIIRFLRILRLLRLAKLKRILIQLEDHIASSTLANMFVLGRLLSLSFLITHWVACLWFLVGNQNFETRSLTWVTVADIQDSPTFDQYITSLYWALTTITTVGYGDIVPITFEEKIIAMITMAISSGFFAYILGSISVLLSKQNEIENSYRETFVSVNSYMKKKQLPYALQFRVRRYLEYIMEKRQKNKINEKELLSLLSIPLRDEILSFMNANVIKICTVFDAFEDNLVAHLTRALENEAYAAGDLIFEQGEMSHKLYYVMNGKIEIYEQRTLTSLAVLKSKSYFGEVAFFLNRPRCAASRCLEFSDLMSLNRSDLQPLLEKFPEANLIVDSFMLDCLEGDYSSLGISCYICEQTGHVATRCKVLLLNLDQETVKTNWLNRQTEKRNLNINDGNLPRFIRKNKKKVVHHWKKNFGNLSDQAENEGEFLKLATVKPKFSIIFASESSDLEGKSAEEDHSALLNETSTIKSYRSNSSF